MVMDLVRNDKAVKVVFRELPILREESDYAAEVSLAAREQGKFLDFHNAMMQASGVLTKERIHDIARKQGLNVDKLQAAAKNNIVPAAIAQNHAIAREIGVEGTPTFIIATLDGAYIDFVPGFDQQVIKDKIAEAKLAAR